MTVTIGIIGFGRISRFTLALIIDSAPKVVQVNRINATGPVETKVHFLRYDSVQGQFNGIVQTTDKKLDNGLGPIKVFTSFDPTTL